MNFSKFMLKTCTSITEINMENYVDSIVSLVQPFVQLLSICWHTEKLSNRINTPRTTLYWFEVSAILASDIIFVLIKFSSFIFLGTVCNQTRLHWYYDNFNTGKFLIRSLWLKTFHMFWNFRQWKQYFFLTRRFVLESYCSLTGQHNNTKRKDCICVPTAYGSGFVQKLAC